MGETHAQVNRSLRRDFERALAAGDWSVALLQEAPPRWLAPLCRAAGANGALALTSRNLLPFLRALLATLNPDLIGSSEGGSNMVLVRPPWRIVETERAVLATFPERRRLLLARAAEPGAPGWPSRACTSRCPPPARGTPRWCARPSWQPRSRPAAR